MMEYWRIEEKIIKWNNEKVAKIKKKN